MCMRCDSICTVYMKSCPYDNSVNPLLPKRASQVWLQGSLGALPHVVSGFNFNIYLFSSSAWIPKNVTLRTSVRLAA